jgi:tRNA nucleotidyltransferase/poly(A) polymerase
MDQKQKQRLLKIIREIKSPGEKVYLVGGAVRDQIIGLPIHDLDFVVKKDPELLAKKLAHHLKAGVYILDDLRHTARVVINTKTEPSITLDFAKFRGPSLLEDLTSRDFTINSMAIDLDHPIGVVDPLDGKVSLKDHKLQLSSSSAFEDDPIRVLRAVRFCIKFQLFIDPVLKKNIKKYVPAVNNPSKERQRDEIFQILALDQVAEGIQLLDELGLIDLIFPQVSPLKEIMLPSPAKGTVWDHTEKVVSGLIKIIGWLDSIESGKRDQDTLGELFVTSLRKFFPQLREYISGTIVADRSRRTLLVFAAILHDSGVKICQSSDWDGSTRFFCLEKISADIASALAAGFSLSNKEQEFIHRVIENHSLPESMKNSVYPLDRRTIYRFFQTTGDAGVAVCLLALADSLSIHENRIPLEEWKAQLAIVQALFHAWWLESSKTVNVTPLLTGDDLQKQLSLKPGPRIGSLLESLKEEQASGLIKTRAKAITFIKHCLEIRNEKNQR